MSSAMAICDVCGEPIVFRYMDGRPTPIHVNGNWCRGYWEAGTPRESGPFRTIRSYVNPDAICPVCGKTIFFYHAPNGGRVFFDALGWPWPKHPCTDNRQQVRRLATRERGERIYAFRARDGSRLALFDLDDFEEHSTSICLPARTTRPWPKRSNTGATLGSLRRWQPVTRTRWTSRSAHSCCASSSRAIHSTPVF